jgi:hypothetical protein
MFTSAATSTMQSHSVVMQSYQGSLFCNILNKIRELTCPTMNIKASVKIWFSNQRIVNRRLFVKTINND